MSIKNIEKRTRKGSPSVNQQIRSARKLTGLTLEELGQQIGVSAQALSAIETGKANPSRQTLINLARVLENDFGEAWLKRYSTSSGGFTHRQIVEKTITDRESLYPRDEANWDDYIWDWVKESQDAASLPRPVKLFKQKSALMPIHYEVVGGITLTKYEGDDKVGVPYSMIPLIEVARCVRVQGKPIRDAFVCPGDILVLRETSMPEEGNVVLALVNRKVVIGNWKLTARKVTFTPLDADCESLVVPRREVEFVGRLIGVLRFIAISSDSFKQ